jgi:hypothetical protein
LDWYKEWPSFNTLSSDFCRTYTCHLRLCNLFGNIIYLLRTMFAASQFHIRYPFFFTVVFIGFFCSWELTDPFQHHLATVVVPTLVVHTLILVLFTQFSTLLSRIDHSAVAKGWASCLSVDFMVVFLFTRLCFVFSLKIFCLCIFFQYWCINISSFTSLTSAVLLQTATEIENCDRK